MLSSCMKCLSGLPWVLPGAPLFFSSNIKDDSQGSLCNPYNAMQCEYYNEDELIRKQSRCKHTLNIISLNIRSLSKHVGELLVFLEALEINFHIITVAANTARRKITDARCMEDIFIAQTSYASDTQSVCR